MIVGALAVAALGSLGLYASTAAWDAGDVFVGFDNQFGGADPNAAHWRVFDPSGQVKDDVSQVDPASYVSACAFDRTSANVDLWTTGYWDSTVRHYDGAPSHTLLETVDLAPFTNGGAVSSIVFSYKPGGEKGFYVSATYTKPSPSDPDQTNIFYFRLPLNASHTPDATFTVDTSGYRGVDWIDLSADQKTLYYSSIDDYGVLPSEIRSFDLVTLTQGPTVLPTSDGVHLLEGKILAFRMLPPGDGTGGYIIATDNDVFHIDSTGLVKSTFNRTPDFVQQMTARGLATEYRFFIDANVTNDGQYVWAASYPQYEDTGNLDPVSGNEIWDVKVPGKLFKFHIPTGTIQAGPFDLGAPGDREFADALCLKREYVASVEQPPCPPGSTDYRCSPPPDCTNPSVSSPYCVVPGAPAITAVVDTESAPSVSYPTPTPATTTITNYERDLIQVQINASSGIADPTLTYSAARLPLGLSLDPKTGLISGRISWDAAGDCGQYCVTTVTATNASGRSASAQFRWVVLEINYTPVPVGIPSQTWQHGQAIAPITVSATDLDPGDALQFSFSPAVPGLAFGPAPTTGSRTQTVSGTPSLAPGVQCPNDVCSVTPTSLLADDGKGTPGAAPLTITILNAPPVLVQPPDQTYKPGVAVSYQVMASDPNGDALTYSMVTSPINSGLVMSPTGLITGAPAVGVYSVAVSALDGHGDSVTKTFKITVSTNAAPMCTAAVASPGQLWPPDHKFSTIAVKGLTDPDNDAITVKFSRILQDEPTLPAGHYAGDGCNGHHHVSGDDYDRWDDNGSGNTSIDGVISGTNMSVAQVRAEREGTSDGRVYEIFFTATDTAGNSCAGSVKVGVPHDQGGMPVPIDSLVRFDSTVAGGAPLQGPAYNLPPVYANPGDQTTNINLAVTLQTVATDRNLDALTYSAAGLPTGLTIKTTTGAISGTPTVAGTYTVTLMASDPYGGANSVTFKWTIVPNRAPVAVSDSVTIQKGASTTVNVLSNDSDPDGDALKIIGISGTYNGTATINSAGTAIVYKPSSSFAGVTQFAYTISDGHGGTATATLRINVSSHSTGDRCDHDRHRNGHYDGDGCEHDRACPSSSHR